MRSGMTRRTAIKTAALATTALIAAPYVRGAHAAGKLSIGFWDHWVPGANDVLTKVCMDWAKKEHVDLKIDYITSQGNKLMLTLAAEELAKSGHDIMEFTNWEAAQHATSLEPTDDVEHRGRGLGGGERAGRAHAILERPARQQFHGDDRHAVEFVCGKHEHRPRMADRRSNLAFAKKARALGDAEA